MPLRQRALLVAASIALLFSSSAEAYDAGTTHAGLTAEAVLLSGLPRFLQAAGFERGIFTPLALPANAIAPDWRLRVVRFSAQAIQPPDTNDAQLALEQWAVDWVVAGSMVAGLTADTERNHFYDPVARSGLANRGFPRSMAVSMAALAEGGVSLAAWATGDSFDLRGEAAPRWVRSTDNTQGSNTQGVGAFYHQLRRAWIAASARERRAALAQSLLALGGLLHVLQDMGSPTHVRNDYAVGQLQRLGDSTFDRGSAYERYVATTYGRTLLPRPANATPIHRAAIADYFSNPHWTGLADLTHAGHYSPGTLPAPLALPESGTDTKRLLHDIARHSRYAEPAVDRVDLGCARRGICYVPGPAGPRAAYRIGPDRMLRFFLDDACFAASAQQLLPLTERFSAGLIDHLWRERIELTREEQTLVLRHQGPQLKHGTLTWLLEDRQGNRQVASPPLSLRNVRPDALVDERAIKELIKGHNAAGATGIHRVIAVIEGVDQHGDPLVGGAILTL